LTLEQASPFHRPRLEDFQLDRWAIALFGAILSLAASGFIAGHNNNIFHLPILGKLYDLPQFAGDPFIQSLRYYSAGLWLALAGSAPDNAFPLLFILTILSRLIFFGGALACGGMIGITTVRSRLIYAGLIAFSILLRDYSYAGGGGLFITDFSHSEVANGTSLWTIYFAARGRFGRAFTANGVTFFLNAFMAVWNAVPVAFIAIAHLAGRTLSPRRMIRQMAIGIAIFLIIASPVILVILSNPEAGAQRTFDYKTYLFQYFPTHFYISAAPGYEVHQLIIIFVAGFIAMLQLGQTARNLMLAFLGYSLIWLFGTIATDLIKGNAIILLHLLRVSALVQTFAAIALAGLATRWIEQTQSWQSRLWGPAVALATTWSPASVMWVIAPLVMGRFRHRHLPPIAIAAGAGAVLLLYAWPSRISIKIHNSYSGYEAVARWRTLGLWARDHSPPNSIFLIPFSPSAGLGRFALGTPNLQQDQLSVGSEAFEYFSRRRIWVDYKRGGVVMWYPSYYPLWKNRVLEVDTLNSLPARLTYAWSHGIAFVVDACYPDAPAPPIYRSAPLCVYRP
jgi:hypothetical protein